MTTKEKKEWLESQVGKEILDGLDDAAYEFYYTAMVNHDMSFSDADRWAWLNTMFGYEISMSDATEIISWYYENDDDVMEIGQSDKETLQNICEFELGINPDFSKWPKNGTPTAIKFGF